MGPLCSKRIAEPDGPWTSAEVSFDQWVRKVTRDLERPPKGFRRQYIAMVRHGHRMDRENAKIWKQSADSKSYPYDCRLTTRGKVLWDCNTRLN